MIGGRSGTGSSATTCAGSCAASPASWLGSQRRLAGSPDLFTSPMEIGQLRHRPRRIHPVRPRRLRSSPQRGQRLGQHRRPSRQPLVELWLGGRRRGPRQRARVAQPSDAQCHVHAPAGARGTDVRRRRRVRPDAGRQQQSVQPGQRDVLDRLGHGRASSPITNGSCGG